MSGNEYEPHDNHYFYSNVDPTCPKCHSSQVVEPADREGVFEWLSCPHIAHSHTPEDVHDYQRDRNTYELLKGKKCLG